MRIRRTLFPPEYMARLRSAVSRRFHWPEGTRYPLANIVEAAQAVNLRADRLNHEDLAFASPLRAQILIEVKLGAGQLQIGRS
jgi:hypothetical protein